MRTLALVGFFLTVVMITAAVGPPAPSLAAMRTLVERQACLWKTSDMAEFAGLLHPVAVFAYPGKRLTGPARSRPFMIRNEVSAKRRYTWGAW